MVKLQGISKTAVIAVLHDMYASLQLQACGTLAINKHMVQQIVATCTLNVFSSIFRLKACHDDTGARLQLAKAIRTAHGF